MNKIELTPQTPQNNRVSKLVKTFDLKYLKTPKNAEQSSITFFRKNQTYGTTRNKPIKHNQYNSLEKAINNNDNKIKYILSDKNTNKNRSNDLLSQQKKIFNSSSKFKSNSHIQSYKEFKNNSKEDKYQKLNLFSQTLDSRRNSSNNKINSYPQFSKDNKKVSQKNHNINQRINDYNLNSNSVISKSVKHHTTIQSTVSTFVPALSPQKDSSLIRKKVFKETTYRLVNKKNINNFVFSKSSSKPNNISDIKKFTAVIKNRRKYPFILNPKPLKPTKFKDLPPNVLKMNNKFVNLLRIENEKVFTHFFSIIEKEKFSKKFQNIVNMYDIKDKTKKNKKKDDKKYEEGNSSSDSLINEDIISGKELLNELKKEENKRKIKPKKIDKKLLFYKIKKYIILLNSKMQMMSVYLNEIISNYKLPKHSYSSQSTHKLIFAIKSKNEKLVNEILDNNKNIVLDFDYFNMTALHWAAKYNFYQIIPKLIEYGAQVDAFNYIGDTPLLISVRHKYIESAVFLLLYLASPFTKDNEGLDILDYCKDDYRISNIFKKIISLHYISFFHPTKNRLDIIQTKFIEYIVAENKNDLKLGAYNLIKEKLDYYITKKNNN